MTERARAVFAKPPLAFGEQVDKLAARGMRFDDRRHAELVLARLNYYRLTAYWFPFYADDDRTRFRPGTVFETVVAHYEFDRQLRLLLLDAIERFEVALRTQFSYHIAHKLGPFAHESGKYFRTAGYKRCIKNLHTEIDRSHETFISHYKRKYACPDYPPVWVACEVMSLGMLSKLFSLVRQRQLRQAIARQFGVDETVLTSFAHHVSTVRNICAHHARLWNRTLTVRTKLPKIGQSRLLDARLNRASQASVYNTIVLLDFFLFQIDTDQDWLIRVKDLIHRFPMVDVTSMGFPATWQEQLDLR